jgi:hypothetical protein
LGVGKKRRRVPAKPLKRPKSPYFFFVQEKLAEFKGSNPDQTYVRNIALIAAAWNELTPEQKRNYEKIAETDRDRYVAQSDAEIIQ